MLPKISIWLDCNFNHFCWAKIQDQKGLILAKSRVLSRIHKRAFCCVNLVNVIVFGNSIWDDDFPLGWGQDTYTCKGHHFAQPNSNLAFIIAFAWNFDDFFCYISDIIFATRLWSYDIFGSVANVEFNAKPAKAINCQQMSPLVIAEPSWYVKRSLSCSLPCLQKRLIIPQN